MLRECRQEDRDIWISLNREFMEYEYEEENLWENPLEKNSLKDIFYEIIEDKAKSNRIFIIEGEDSMPVGFMNCVVFLSPWAGGKVLFLDDFYIADEYRGKKIGRRALMELETLIKSEGYVRIQLMAEKTNPRALSFYLSQGYSKQELNFVCKYI